MRLYEMTFSQIHLEPVSEEESVPRPLTSLKHSLPDGRSYPASESGSCGPEALLFRRYPRGISILTV